MSPDIVYSTAKGRTCPACGQNAEECQCAAKNKKRISGDGNVKVMRETKGRKGKGVTIIQGLAMNEAQIKRLAKELKGKCGSGGTVKNGVIEIQGDHRDGVMNFLNQRGINAKRAGG